MKKTITTICGLASFSTWAYSAVIYTEDFETDGEGSRYTSNGVFNSSTQDYWGRENTTTTDRAYTGISGSFFYGGQDTVGSESLTISGINIAGQTGLSFSALFAEQRPEAGGNDDIDAPDFALVEYQIDGGGFQNLISFKNDGTTFNTTFLQDTDFNGTGDGTQLETNFQEFTVSIAGTGSTLDLRFTASVDSGDEDIAIDNIRINAVPEPSSAALLGLGGLALVLRRRK